MVGISAWRKLIYSLIWQSVMWRPGKLRFLIGVKNPLPIDRPRPPEKTGPCGAPPVARFATPVGLRPPFVTHPATLPPRPRLAGNPRRRVPPRLMRGATDSSTDRLRRDPRA